MKDNQTPGREEMDETPKWREELESYLIHKCGIHKEILLEAIGDFVQYHTIPAATPPNSDKVTEEERLAIYKEAYAEGFTAGCELTKANLEQLNKQ